MSLVLLSGTTSSAGGGILTIVLYLVFLFGLMYLMIIRPQKKQQKQMQELHNSMEPGDNIMTTGGFYGTILDIVDDTTVIVEFGNNKNCRIPMHKNAIAEVEKAGSAIVKNDETEEPKETKEVKEGKIKK